MGAPGRVIGPRLGKIKAMGDGQAGMVGCDREGDCNLAIILLAELTTILAGDAD